METFVCPKCGGTSYSASRGGICPYCKYRFKTDTWEEEEGQEDA
ncbi:hypothetical protein HKBW3S42_00868 [Candidatus Hakubella thermalkaliphila]|uniref:Uncharacterized protein n=1 Tax=Candidatus Hakubella thermalkaliphila TaxID=2754717 RepID=A0A6V8NPD4_9ACTN|nr:hypothetical protein [Candidatus Hakubella thermalkaliphila]MBT9170960.1 hypothetical protein [Actinomycetota bacterium]GFP22198.1 hypothetical protein HKBW3S06_01425 [Candidatus Hakubella thermalkaliphila]GFP24361.1 hypothetical protein HKBW3S09_01828 [Candidatus Hakubella thermalkaliphila]GFP31342.1 hypothetical protein HKBW3S34_02262 [Candidatus Hakubella thermalkaliphila]GFP32564.1 hypothetical protein HKBW3S42_00868 [Candidatus Hakubella thermalkaliphila]